MIVANYNFNYGQFKIVEIVVEKPPLRLVNPDNLRREIGEDNWEYLRKIIERKDEKELRRISKFFEDPAKKAGRERRYISIMSKVPQHKILTATTLTVGLSLEGAKVIDKAELKLDKKKFNEVCLEPLMRQLVHTTEDDIEKALHERIEYCVKTDPWRLFGNSSKPIFIPWRSGRDPFLDYLSYNLTRVLYGELFY